MRRRKQRAKISFNGDAVGLLPEDYRELFHVIRLCGKCAIYLHMGIVRDLGGTILAVVLDQIAKLQLQDRDV